MIKWLENYYKREDEKYLHIIQNSDNIEKHLSTLYRNRVIASSISLLIFLTWILSIFFMPSSGTEAGSGLVTIILLASLNAGIEFQIKIFQLSKFITSALESKKEPSSDANGKA